MWLRPVTMDELRFRYWHAVWATMPRRFSMKLRRREGDRDSCTRRIQRSWCRGTARQGKGKIWRCRVIGRRLQNSSWMVGEGRRGANVYSAEFGPLRLVYTWGAHLIDSIKDKEITYLRKRNSSHGHSAYILRSVATFDEYALSSLAAHPIPIAQALTVRS